VDSLCSIPVDARWPECVSHVKQIKRCICSSASLSSLSVSVSVCLPVFQLNLAVVAATVQLVALMRVRRLIASYAMRFDELSVQGARSHLLTMSCYGRLHPETSRVLDNVLDDVCQKIA
jgi:hypothetical protein